MEFRSARRSERDEVLDLLSLWYGDREFFERCLQEAFDVRRSERLASGTRILYFATPRQQ